MSDQEKRGNVIKALELCTSKIETRTRVPCEICPYHSEKYHGVHGDGYCNMRSLQRDMLALLKAQEPVVMTWQEVIGAAIECKPLYVEVKDSEDKEPGDDRWAMVTQYKDSITNGIIRAMSSYITSEIFCKDWYGKTWRCWTSRPDQATMEATPWN